MALNVANWTDKQLDELADLLRTGNYSAVAAFIAENFLGTGSKIMTDPSQTTLRATVGSDPKTIVLSAGVFLHAGLVSELDTDQIVNVLDTSTGAWGSGTAADLTNPRWDIIQVKNNEQLHTPASRWFVNDTVVPNTYYQQLVNTLINKAYYDITVKAGTPNPVPQVPDSDPGYWTIAEIYIPALAGTILPGNVHDTATSPLPPTYDSQHTPPNWTDISRVARLEFWSTLFGADHSLVDGHHREGVWQIGTDIVTSTAAELNKLHGSGGTVTPASLKKITDTSTLGIGELHSHYAPLVGQPGGSYSVVGTSLGISVTVDRSYLCLCTIGFYGGEGEQTFNWYKDGGLHEQLTDCMGIFMSGGNVTLFRFALTFHTVMPFTVGAHTVSVGWSGSYGLLHTPRITVIPI